MKMIFAAAQSTDERVRVASYQCLVEIASSYYEFLQEYIQLIFQVHARLTPPPRPLRSFPLLAPLLTPFNTCLDDGQRHPERARGGGFAGS
jgi:hypothetical protein